MALVAHHTALGAHHTDSVAHRQACLVGLHLACLVVHQALLPWRPACRGPAATGPSTTALAGASTTITMLQRCHLGPSQRR